MGERRPECSDSGLRFLGGREAVTTRRNRTGLIQPVSQSSQVARERKFIDAAYSTERNNAAKALAMRTA
jgi:hypothetical protein